MIWDLNLTIWGRTWDAFWEHLLERLANVPEGFCLFLSIPLTINQQPQQTPDHKPQTTHHKPWERLLERLDKCSHTFLAYKSMAIQDRPGGSRAALRRPDRREGTSVLDSQTES